MADKEDKSKPICGIVMPISELDGCSENHWTDVHDILNEAIEVAGFEPNLVSNADDVGIIQKRIIQNLYDNPIVICDVSGKNPNVMFELGLRLAFDRPTIIVKDDKTSFSFDTSPIEHLEYPRDLRFGQIIEFKAKLSDKITNTHQKASNDPDYTTFLKHFGEFKVAKIDKREVSGQEFIIDELRNLRMAVSKLDRKDGPGTIRSDRQSQIDICGEGLGRDELREVAMQVAKKFPVRRFRMDDDHGHYHLGMDLSPGYDSSLVERSIEDLMQKKRSGSAIKSKRTSRKKSAETTS